MLRSEALDIAYASSEVPERVLTGEAFTQTYNAERLRDPYIVCSLWFQKDVGIQFLLIIHILVGEG